MWNLFINNVISFFQKTYARSQGVLGGFLEGAGGALPYIGIASLTLVTSYFFYPSLLVNLSPLLVLWGWKRRIPSSCFIGLPLIPFLCVGGGGPLYFLFVSALLIFSTYPMLILFFGGDGENKVQPRVMNDLWWVLIAGIGFSATVFFNTLRLHHNFQTGVWDLGVYDNVFFNIISGNGQSTPVQRCNPDVSHLNIHKSYFYFLLAPLYSLYPRAESLLLFNAMAVTGSGVALYLFAKAVGLDRFCVLSISLIWIFYFPTQGAAFFQFHESSFAPIFLFLSGWALFSQKPVWAFMFFALTLSVKEDYAFAWGPLFLLMGWWSGRKLVGGIMFSTCLVYVGVFFLFPNPLDENFGVLFSNTGEGSVGGVLSLLLLRPDVILESLWQSKNLQGAAELLLPVALLPLHTAAGVVSLFLPAGLCYIPSHDSLALNRLQYSYTLAGPVFVSTLYSLFLMGAGRRKAWVGVAVVGTIIVQFVFGVGNPNNTIQAGGDYFKVPHLITDGGDRRKELLELTQDIPRDARVMASNTILPHFSARPLAYGYEVCQMDRDGYFQGNVRNLRWEQLDPNLQPQYVVLWKPAGHMLEDYKKHSESLHFEVWINEELSIGEECNTE